MLGFVLMIIFAIMYFIFYILMMRDTFKDIDAQTELDKEFIESQVKLGYTEEEAEELLHFLKLLIKHDEE